MEGELVYPAWVGLIPLISFPFMFAFILWFIFRLNELEFGWAELVYAYGTDCLDKGLYGERTLRIQGRRRVQWHGGSIFVSVSVFADGICVKPIFPVSRYSKPIFVPFSEIDKEQVSVWGWPLIELRALQASQVPIRISESSAKWIEQVYASQTANR